MNFLLLLVPEQQEGKTPQQSMLLSYLLYLRLKVTNSRTVLMIAEKNQPKDCIRLTEMILHNLQEMKTIPGMDSGDFQADVEDQSTVYKGIKCRYLADIFKTNKKWSEALVLSERAQEYFNKARKGTYVQTKYTAL